MDLPEEFDSCVHVIGRAGRAGHTGLPTNLYVPGDVPKVGNRKISWLLIGQLREVPEVLEMECANNGAGGGKKKFGGRDAHGGGNGNNGGGTRQNGGGCNKM